MSEQIDTLERQEEVNQSIALLNEEKMKGGSPHLENELACLYLEKLKWQINLHEYDAAIQTADLLISLDQDAVAIPTFDSLVYYLGQLLFSAQKEGALTPSLLESVFSILPYFPKLIPSRKYSYLVKALLNAEISPEDFIRFVDQWGLDNFMPTDYERSQRKGHHKPVSPLVAKVYSKYAVSLLQGVPVVGEPFMRQYDIAAIDAFLPKMIDVCQLRPDYDIPRFYLAKLLHVRGRNDEALYYLTSYLRSHKDRFEGWDLLAEILEDDDETRISCYCKALVNGGTPERVVKMLSFIAEYLMGIQEYALAKAVYLRLINFHKRNAWPLPYALMQLDEHPILKDVEPEEDCKEKLYKAYGRKAENLLYGDLPEIQIVVEHYNPQKAILKFRASREREGIFKYKSPKELPEKGDLFLVRLTPIDSFRNQLESIEKLSSKDTISCPSFKIAQGVARLVGNGSSAFVGDCYLPASFLKRYQIQGGDELSVRAIEMYNDKLNKWTWVAVGLAS